MDSNGWVSKNASVLVSTAALLLTMGAGWSNLSQRVRAAEVQIVANKESAELQLATNKEDIREIKEGVKDGNKKLDELKDMIRGKG